MTTPIEPEVCVTTGRLLTEWFEFPEYDDEQLLDMALLKYNATRADYNPNMWDETLSPETRELARRVHGFISARKRTRWVHNMTQQEVQARMNEASKMVAPDNFKFLPQEVSERTGLSLNPLWMMECLIRSGVLQPKEMMAGLRDLAQYTHSKAPTVNHNTNTEMKPEDWLFELAKDEYKTIDVVAPEKLQPREVAEVGSSVKFENERRKKIQEAQVLHDYSQSALAEFEALFTEEDEEDVFGDDS